ncbi:hypothetical protein [Vallitalea sp.]|jgi:hypothetical protein|uniref:hypothetical protein n=1 Tax=Vallitalea sp. TaxID=1882829 RepID=UPI0025DE0D54|nr:hypothetical protein [Vallitalea sp.]MCT4686796.1 hypothetical protein [Vallitalea sp.]
MKKKTMKRALNIYMVLLLIITGIFYYSKLLDYDLIKLLMLIMSMNIIVFAGIIGLKTNTIIIGRGGDLEYDNTSAWGKIANYFLILFGVVFIIIALVIYIV